MILAGIDFGTNSVRLLVCDCIRKDNRILITPIERQTKITQLGKNLHGSKLITENAIENTQKALDEYKQILNTLKPKKTYAVATSVFRDAKNGLSTQQQLERYAGFPIQIISGKKEAELTFNGMFANRDTNKSETSACIDIGGGSCEIIFSRENNIIFNKSYNIGCLRSKHIFLKNNPPSELEIESLKQNILSTVSQDIKKYSPKKAICFGGTVTSLAAIFNKKFPVSIESLENFVLEKITLDSFLKETKNLSETEIAKKYQNYLDKGRESVIFPGTVIINCLMDILKINSLIVTNQGILFGLIFNIFKKSLKNK